MRKYYYGSLKALKVKSIRINKSAVDIATECITLSKNTIYYTTNSNRMIRFEDDEEVLSIEEAQDFLKKSGQNENTSSALCLCYNPEDIKRLPLSNREETSLEGIKLLIKKRNEASKKDRK